MKRIDSISSFGLVAQGAASNVDGDVHFCLDAKTNQKDQGWKNWA